MTAQVSNLFTSKISYIIIISLVGSLGMGGGNIYINAIDDVEDKLHDHIVNDATQLGITITTLEHILQYQSENKIALKELSNEIQLLKIVICSMKEVNCS